MRPSTSSSSNLEIELEAKNDTAILQYCQREGGPKVKALGNFLHVDKQLVADAQQGAEQILNAERKILASMLETHSREQLLTILGIPHELAPMIAALENPETELPMMRLDLLPTSQGELKICEFNVGSSLGAAEAFEFARLTGVSEPGQLGPYEYLAKYIEQELEKLSIRTVAIFDWSTWQDYGMFNLDTMVRVFKAQIPDVEILVLNENDVENRIDEKVLLFRIFMATDALNDPSLVRRALESAGKTLTDFSGDLFGSKAWLHMLHDDEHQSILSPSEREAIATYIPRTRLVSEAVMKNLIELKESYFFKAASDFGGHGVIDGRTWNKEELLKVLSLRSNERWVAQERVEVGREHFRLAGSSQWFSSEYVLGTFKMGDDWSGCMVRANPSDSVINIARGASVGWSS